MPKSSVWNLFALGVAMPLVAGAASPPLQTGIAPPTRISNASPPVAGPIGEQVPTASMPRDVRRAVVADAAKRFKVTESAVVLARAEKVMWNDGSLGCPEPGRRYAQLLVPGFRVVASTREGNFTYHTDGKGNVRICLDSTPLPMMDTEPQPYPPKQNAPEK
jgi:hypothetical protein